MKREGWGLRRDASVRTCTYKQVIVYIYMYMNMRRRNEAKSTSKYINIYTLCIHNHVYTH